MSESQRHPEIRPCPRCGEAMKAHQAGASRATEERDIDVCGPCCSDEAGRESAGMSAPKMAEWPVRRMFDGLGRRL